MLDLAIPEIQELIPFMTEDERRELFSLIEADMHSVVWRPLPGPQTLAYNSRADVLGYGGAAGGGKLLPLTEVLPTPDGFVSVGEVKIGDTLFDKDGAPCRVTGLSAIEPLPELWTFEFDDGTEITSCVDHRWLTFDAKELAALTKRDPEWKARRRAKRPSRAKGNKSEAFMASIAARNAARARAADTLPLPQGSVHTTAEILRSLRTLKGRANHAVPVAGAIDTPAADLLVPPYTLGAWLGDGSSRNSQLTGEDHGVWERIEAEGFKVQHYSWSPIAHNILGLQASLRAIGVQRNKHIPPEYLRASFDQRLALLQGLMDTDGHATLDGSCEFDGTSEQLVDGVLELALSLGIKATKTAGIATLNGQYTSDKWRVSFTTSLPVFGLERKAKRQNLIPRRTTRFRYIVGARPAVSQPGRCLQVDSPSRTYLAGRQFIPTHNTDLMIGSALTHHTVSYVLRREATQMRGIYNRLFEIVGGRDGFNGAEKYYRTADGRMIQFGSTPHLGDEMNYQGQARDLLGLDETSNFLEAQVRFLMGWVRTTKVNQPCQTILAFNPPTSAEGRWVVPFFGPWLDEKHPNPALPGEIRWFVTLDGEEVEWFDGTPFPNPAKPDELLLPQSRTFIPSRVTDNPFLVRTGYMATLQALPEPLRSQMLYGDFRAGMKDDPWQVIPTRWIEDAQARWTKRQPRPDFSSLGVDVARGGEDSTMIARCTADLYFDELLEYPGKETPDGPTTAALCIAANHDHSPIHIDVIGVGASPYDFLKEANQQVMGVNVSERSIATDRSGRLSFKNLRSELWWTFRELLDPSNNHCVALPPGRELLMELAAPLWSVKGSEIYVESREEIVKRIGRSPDRATAVILAAIRTPRMLAGSMRKSAGEVAQARRDYDPYKRSPNRR